jgi:predicted nucleic acid-binding protein
MTAYVLDTNIVSALLRNDAKVNFRLRVVVEREDLIVECPMVWREVLRGLLIKNAFKQRQAFEKLFATFTWQDYSRDDWSLAVELWAQRRAMGLPIADADLLMAAFARNRDAVLVTNNEKDFYRLGVTLQNWSL